MRRFEQVDEHAIRLLVDRFYAAVRADKDLGPIFAGAVHDWDAHLDKLASFWSSVMLTSGRYQGNPFGAHLPLPITPDLFDRWLGLWRTSVNELFAPEPAAIFALKAERIAQSLKAGLFFRPTAPPPMQPAAA